MFRCLVMDFGSQFARTFEDGSVTHNAWMHRLAGRVSGLSPSNLIDGYDRARQARAPHMPVLNDIADAAHEVARLERMREDEVARAVAPRFSGGLLGYVDTVLAAGAEDAIADAAISAMRKTLTSTQALTTAERQNRLTENVKQLAAMVASVKTHRRAEAIRLCDVPGCDRAGSLAHSTRGEGPWYCRKHFWDSI